MDEENETPKIKKIQKNGIVIIFDSRHTWFDVSWQLKSSYDEPKCESRSNFRSFVNHWYTK